MGTRLFVKATLAISSVTVTATPSEGVADAGISDHHGAKSVVSNG